MNGGEYTLKKLNAENSSVSALFKLANTSLDLCGMNCGLGFLYVLFEAEVFVNSVC